MTEQITREAVLLSSARPTAEQEARFLAFLKEKYGAGVTLSWRESSAYPGGFRLEVGAEVYDWSAEGRLRQFRDALERLAQTDGDVIPLLKETVLSWTPKALAQEIGTVLTVGDGIARVDGLAGAAYGEILLFEGGVRGMVLDLSRRAPAVSCSTMTRASARAARCAAPGVLRAFPWARAFSAVWSMRSACRLMGWAISAPRATALWKARLPVLSTGRAWIRRWRPASSALIPCFPSAAGSVS